MTPASRKRFLHIQTNYRGWIHFETRTWHDNNIKLLFITFNWTLNTLKQRFPSAKMFPLAVTHKGLASVLEVQYLFIFTKKKIGFAPKHGLWAKLNNRVRGQFGCNRTWFCFCFNFVSSNAQCGCSSIISLRFQVKQIKQVDYKISAKNLNYYK